MIPIKFAEKQFQGKYCLTPFNSIHINPAGNVNICLCPSWQPTFIGNIYQSSLQELLDSPLARAIRKSIIDGTYSYCNENQCPLIINDALNSWDAVPANIQHQLEDPARFNMPYEIAFNGDRTCNLSCPSCRTKVIKVGDDELDRQKELANKVYNNLFSIPCDQPINFITSGSGEVFASPLLLSLLEKITLDKFPNFKLNLHTNGLLAQSRWNRIQHLESKITQITVSIDAATPDTYRVVRRGGEWADLMNNMQFIVEQKKKLNFKLHARLIVQKQNYKEIAQFYDLCQSLEIDRVEYSRLINWGTWNREEFKENDVFDTNHPERSQAYDLMQAVRSRPRVWLEGNFN